MLLWSPWKDLAPSWFLSLSPVAQTPRDEMLFPSIIYLRKQNKTPIQCFVVVVIVAVFIELKFRTVK